MPHSSPFEPLDIPKCNILSYLFADGRESSDKPIWIDAANPNNSLSLQQMLLWIKRFAVGLDKLGIEEGKTVMILSPNHIFVPTVYLGAAGSKRTFTGANPISTVNEVAFQMKAIEAAIVLIHPSILSTGIAAAKEVGIPTDRLFLFSDQEHQPTVGVRDWRSILGSEFEARQWKWDPLDGEDSITRIACINFSSGTTGLPKGVCITHRNLVANASQGIFNKYYGTPYSAANPEKEVWLAFLPLYHAYSQLWTINIAALLQIPVYVMPKFVYEDFLRYIEKYRVTNIQAVPPVCVMLAKRPETRNYDISSLKHMMVGAAPMKSDLQNEVSDRFDLVISQGYGMTETTCLALLMPGKVKDETGSTGQLIPNTEAMIVDDNGNEITKSGEPGELCIRGPQIMLKYWRNEQATRESKVGGWFHTGDVAVCKDGWWWIVDRKKELIKVKGLQVAPAELEGVLLESNDIADAAVVGVTLNDEEYPRGYVVLNETAKGKVTEKDIQRFIEGKMARHKWLTGGVKFVNEVPKLASGKIIRKQMKEWAKRDASKLEKNIKARL